VGGGRNRSAISTGCAWSGTSRTGVPACYVGLMSQTRSLADKNATSGPAGQARTSIITHRLALGPRPGPCALIYRTQLTVDSGQRPVRTACERCADVQP